MPQISIIEYFSDGCAAQYKNYKNFLNLCYHKDEFGLNAIWSFFATSHGKSPCDGIGGTVKRQIARASLHKPLNDQILTFDAVKKLYIRFLYIIEHFWGSATSWVVQCQVQGTIINSSQSQQLK